MFVLLVFALLVAALVVVTIAFRQTIAAAEGAAGVNACAGDAPRVASRKIDWELFTGGRLFSIVGAIMVIVGGGLLMKYAIDHGWFPPSLFGVTVRVLAGFAAGALLLFAGDRQLRASERGERTWFGQALVGAGLGSLYISGNAACASAQLVSLDASFAIMSFVTVVAFALALRYDAFAIAMIGWFGAFVAPFVVADPNVGQTDLAGYLVLLDLGLCAIALVKRSWFALAPLALVASSLSSAVWFVQHAENSVWYVSAIALGTSWAIFFATGLIQRLREDSTVKGYGVLAEVGNTAIFWAYLSNVLSEQREVLHAMLAGVAAILMFGYALCAKRGRAPFVRATYAALAILSTINVTSLLIAPLVERTMVFTLEALALAALGARFAKTMLARREVLAASCAIFAAACATSLAADVAIWGLPARALGFTLRNGDLAAVLMAAAAFALDRFAARRADVPIIGRILRGAGMLVALGFVFAHFRGAESATFIALQAAIVLALDRALRDFGGLFESRSERFAIVVALMAIAATILLATPGVFVYRGATFAFGIAGADLAIVATIAVSALLAFTARRAGARGFALIGRILVTLLILGTSAAHAREYGLASLYALEGLGGAALAWNSAHSGAPRAYDIERFVRATVFALAALVTYVTLPGAFAFRGTEFAWGIGGADLALASIVVAGLALSRVAVASAFRHDVVIALRQAAFLVATVALCLHVSDLRFAGAFALVALAMTACSATARRNADPASSLEFVIDAFLALASSDLSMLFARATWHVDHIVRFAPIFNERFAAYGCAALATIAFATYLKRTAMVTNGAALALRALGIAIVIVDLTLDMRDAFGGAIARTANDLASPGAIAHLQTLEAVTISLVWAVASIAILAIGIGRRARDLRIFALGLFDLTIVKAFFFDIATPGALERIIAFIGLGLVLLGVSYAYQRFERSLRNGPAPRDPLEERASLAA